MEYWIRGDDGEEYGPVDMGELESWIQENRIGLDTPVRIETACPDVEEDWIPAENVHEIAEAIQKFRSERRAQLSGTPAAGLELAEIWQRAGALSFDLAIFFMAISLFQILAEALFPATFNMELIRSMIEAGHIPVGAVIKDCFTLVFVTAYFSIFHGLTGQTPGKRFFNIRVVDNNGLTLMMGRSFLRSVIETLSIYPMFGVGLIFALFLPHKRALHDLVAQTVVIQVRKPDY